MITRWALVATLAGLAGCGRLGFDAHGGGSGSGGTPIALDLPSGGAIIHLALVPNGPWFAVATDGAAYRSDDHQSWVPCGALAVTTVSAVNSTTVYAGGSDVNVSTDACATWQPLPTGTPHGPSNKIVRHLLLTGDVLVASGDAGVFTSHDGGITWAASAISARSNVALVDPADGQLVVGTNGHGIAKTAIP